jgi:hypothetical protein
MPESLDTRATGLEESMRRAFTPIEAPIEKEKKAQIATQKTFQETDARIDRLVTQMETAALFGQTGARIENPVSAIDEMLRNRP